MPPRVGITLATVRARWGIWKDEDPAELVDRRYTAMLQGAGALVRPILMDDRLAEHPGFALDGLDALVLPGGADVEPARYGAPRDPRTQDPDPLRDEVESALLDEAIARGMPVLGICRGAQLLNVVRGGTLHQHVRDVVGHDLHMQRPDTMEGCVHEVEVLHDTRLAEIMGAGRRAVVSHHHQGIDRLGEGLRVTARAQDGLAEAIELVGPRLCIGVQWHPERDGSDGLLAGFVAAAARLAAG